MVAVKKDVVAAVKVDADAATMDVVAAFLWETVCLTETPVAVFSGSSFLCASAAIITMDAAIAAMAATAAGSS